MPLSFFRSKRPQLDLGEDNDASVPLENGATGDGIGKRWWGFNRRRLALARHAPANSMLFFGLCDMRIATVLLNLMHMIFTFLLEVVNAADWSDEEIPVLAIIAFLFSGLGIVGALNFGFLAMTLSTIGLICLFCLYVSTMHIFGLVILCLILFAQVVFMIEMRKGIMTKETYAREEYIVPEGRQALQKAHSYANDVAETSKVIALEVRVSSASLLSPDTLLGLQLCLPTVMAS